MSTLDELSRELLSRLSKDDDGPPAVSGSHLVGRLVKSASALENLLREAVVQAAAHEGRPPEDLLALVGGKKPSLRKSMAGPLAHGLRQYFAGRAPASIPKSVEPLIADLVASRSVILDFITVRNDVAKEDGDPKQGRAAATKLKKLIQEFRKRSGWSD